LYNNEDAMAHCLIEILGIHPCPLDTGSSEILHALEKSGFSKFYLEFTVLGPNDIMDVPVDAYGG
jgi:hypothetical protein